MRKKLLAAIGLASAILIASVVLVILGFGSHNHTFSEEWKYDDTKHWHEVTCNHSEITSDKTEHNFDTGVITKAATCEQDGERKVKCVCGATKTETVETMGHAYMWKTQVKGTCASTEVQEGTCSGCGITTTRELEISGEHKWGTWHVAKKSTCVTKGVEERVCELDKSHKETRKLKLRQHEYVGYQITKAPTTAQEGAIKAKCSHCGKDTTLKVMRTPQITLQDAKLTWSSVKKAKGYRLYDNGKLVANLGNTNSCMISTNAGVHNYTIEAYTKNVKYHNVSLKSDVVAVKIQFGENLQIVKRTDFEGFLAPSGELLRSSGWKADGEGDVVYVSERSLENEIVTEANGNKCIKFYTSTGADSSIDFAGNPKIAKAGIYKMSTKVKLGLDATKVDNIGFRFYAQNSLDTGDVTFEGLNKLNSNEWVTLETYFIVPKTVNTEFVNISYWVFTNNHEIKSVDNYVLIDDIAVYPVTINGCNHEYDTYKMTTEPTATTEGVMTANCKKSGCKEALTLKVMMTPQLTRTDVKLSWTEIPNATGYKVYDGDNVVADLVNILTYDIPLTTGTHNYTVESYTDNVDYHSVSLKSNAVKATVTVGENLQASKGTDFEKFVEQNSMDITGEWVSGYANFSAGSVQIMREEGNTFAKLTPSANSGETTLTKACSVDILKAGTYRFSLDVKLGSSADGTLSFGIWDGTVWTPAWPKVVIDTKSAKVDGWTNVTYEFAIPTDQTGTFANLDLTYTAKSADKNNYVLIDNIQMLYTTTNKNVDTYAFGDFEGILPSLTDLLKTSGWKQDSTGNDVIFVGEALENELGIEKNGNKYFKFYTSTGESTSVDFAASTTIATAGIYKISVKVKFGSDATNVDNIGFRFFAENDLNVGDISFGGLEKINGEEWKTLETYFTVSTTVKTSFINMNLWVFTHNNEINSIDNYVLLDDVTVHAVTVSEQ